MTNRKIGGYQYKQDLVVIRNAASNINRYISRIIDENVGQQTLFALLARMAVEINHIHNAAQSIEEITNEQKEVRT